VKRMRRQAHIEGKPCGFSGAGAAAAVTMGPL
jgi:hypothetical protein